MVSTDGRIEGDMPDQPFPIGRRISLLEYFAEPVVLESVRALGDGFEFDLYKAVTGYINQFLPQASGRKQGRGSTRASSRTGCWSRSARRT